MQFLKLLVPNHLNVREILQHPSNEPLDFLSLKEGAPKDPDTFLDVFFGPVLYECGEIVFLFFNISFSCCLGLSFFSPAQETCRETSFMLSSSFT